jgi:tRNA dimethylallyltransferase
VPEPKKDRILAIIGPTGSGKSEVALAAAVAVGGEILSCDSVQVFRGFVIGCAKPSVAERNLVPHHLIDVVDWHEPFDAQAYCTLARAAIADVQARGRRPILCGGTGLYLRTLRWGLVDAPAASPSLRAELMAEEARAPGSLYTLLNRVDPDSAAATPPQNLVRIVRALEIHRLSDKPASQLRAQHGFAKEEVPMRLVALAWPKESLRARIHHRVETMLASGLVDEVRALLAAGVAPGCRAMRSVGYLETVEMLLGRAPVSGLADRIAHSTWAYARRQRTWLNREKDLESWPVDDLGSVTAALVATLDAG